MMAAAAAIEGHFVDIRKWGVGQCGVKDRNSELVNYELRIGTAKQRLT